MKLINKEEALFVLKSNSWNIDGWNKPIELRQAGLLANDMDYRRISELEMIEAIPISWLLNKMQQDYAKCNLDTIAVVEIGRLIDEWRKENGNN